MKKKKWIKRSLGLFMSFVMIFLMLSGSLPVGILNLGSVEAGVVVDYQPAKPGAYIMPEFYKWSNDAMNAVANGFNNTHFFSKYSEKNVANAESTLSSSLNLWHKGNDHWYAQYKWTFGSNTAIAELMKSGQVYIKYDGDIRADYHYNLIHHTDSKWDVGKVIISGIYSDGGTKYTEIISKECNKSQDEVGQKYNLSAMASGGKDYTGIMFEANHSGCNCGSSGVANSVIWMTDGRAPNVAKAYVTRDVKGEDKISDREGFASGDNGYVVLEFDEPIRFSDNTPESLELPLKTYWTKNNQKIDRKYAIVSRLVALKDKRMIFEFTVPDKILDKETSVYIAGVESTPWMYNFEQSYPRCINNASGNKYSINLEETYSTSRSRITDLAGNAMNQFSGDFEVKAFLDSTSPELDYCYYSIERASEARKELKGGSKYFVGVGDKITYSAMFTKDLKGCDVSKIAATLDVYKNGNPIKLKASKIETANTYGGTSVSGTATKIVFEELTIEDGMTIESSEANVVENNKIYITSISGMDSVTDYRNNKISTNLASLNSGITSSLKIDTTVPAATVEEIIPENGIYDPYVEAEDPYIFTIPIKMDDGKGSGVMGLMGTFGLSIGSGNQSFQWYIDSLNTVDENAKWKSGTSMAETDKASSLYQIPQADGVVLYLHIKTNKQFLSEDKIKGTLVVNTVDYLENKGSDEFEFSYDIFKMDSAPPVVTYIDSSMDVDRDNKTINIDAKVRVEDEYLKTIRWWWNDGSNDITTPEIVNVSDATCQEVDASYNFSYENDQSGTRVLYIKAEDKKGGSTVWTKEFEYDETIPIPNYHIEENSPGNPFTIPKISMKEPITFGSPVGSILLIPAGEENIFYVYKNEDSSGNNITNDDIFAGIPTSEKAASHSYKGKWSKMERTINGDDVTFRTIIPYDYNDVWKVGKYISGCYGKMEVTIVTSTSLASNNVYNYNISNHTIIETQNIYMANEAEYNSVISVKGVDGVSELPAYYGDEIGGLNSIAWEEHKILTSLDNANIGLEIINVSDNNIPDEAERFGVSALDFSKSKVELIYQGTDTTYIGKYGQKTVFYTWSLSECANQMFTIPEGVAARDGWYTIRTIVYNLNGQETYIYSDIYMVKDSHTRDFYAVSYEKEYSRNEPYNNKKITVVSKTDLKDDPELKIGLAKEPGDSWEITKNELRIKYEGRVYSVNGVPPSFRMKLWNKQDPNGESNAQWLSSENCTISYDINLICTPVLVTEFKASDYTASNPVWNYYEQGYLLDATIPLIDGDNIICYQIWEPNGTKVTKEILVQVNSQAPQWDLKVDYDYANLEGDEEPHRILATAYADALGDYDCGELEFGMYGFDGVDQEGQGFGTRYIYREDDTIKGYVYDSFGNLSIKSCEIENVDGLSPSVWDYTYNYYPTPTTAGTCENGFHLSYTIQDSFDNINMPLENTYITFDSDYSALLMNTKAQSGEDVISGVSARFPLNADYERVYPYLPGVWQGIDPSYKGIYRTEARYENNMGGYIVDVWGVYKYDPDKDGNSVEINNKVTAYDSFGNTGVCEISATSDNIKPELKFGVLDAETNEFIPGRVLDENGMVGVYCNQPLSQIFGYSASEVKIHINQDGSTYFYSTLPMIMADGIYEVTYTDMFGTGYRQQLRVLAFDDENLKIDISDLDYTNKDVSVSVKALLENDKILSIKATYDDGATATGTIDVFDDTRANIIMSKNGKITVKTDMGITKTIRICNIDKESPEGEIAFCYNGSSTPKFYVDDEGNVSEDTITQTATAIVHCSEDIEAIEGKLSYTFPAGSVKGDTHTFTFTDRAGNTGEITATLPYNICMAPEPEEDNDAPEYMMEISASRNNKLTALNGLYTPENNLEVNDIIENYKAQSYVFNLEVFDESATKVIVKECNAAELTDYATAKSDNIDGIIVGKNSITVTKNNVQFDLYIIDNRNNVISLKGIKVNSIDLEAPKVEVRYETTYNEQEELFIRAKFVPENDEDILSIDGSVATIVDVIENKATGDKKYISRYYHDFDDNSAYTFFYRDVYGNVGTATAEVIEFDAEKPVINSFVWYGLTGVGIEPGRSRIVNRDVIAEIKVNKAIRGIKLYYADSSAADGKGAEIRKSDNLPIKISFVGQTVNIIYEDVVDREIVVEIFASSNGRRVTQTLPAVNCIDKILPGVTVDSKTLSENKRYYTVVLKTDEDTILTENGKGVFEREHTWTVYANGEYVLHITDKAGNITEVPVSVTEIDEKILELSYSKSQDGANAVSNALDLKLTEEMTVYVKASKKADLKMFDNEETVEPEVWTPFHLTGGEGFYSLKATDCSTGEVIYANLSVALLDKKAPVFRFTQNTVCVREGDSEAAIDNIIRSGVSIYDNRDGIITEFSYKVTGVDNLENISSGYYPVVYTTVDAAGNTATATRTIFVFSYRTPIVKINNIIAQPFGLIVVNDTTLDIRNTNNAVVGGAVLKWKPGIWNAAEMKYGSNMILNASECRLPKSGFYTIYVRSQDRQEYVTYIYVDQE